MAKTREIKRRLRSIEKTRQITRTMEMVATSKLKKMSDLVYAARPYSERLGDVIGRLTDPELRERYPLLRQPETVRRAAVILLTSNRGLAGAFNVNLIREARQLMERLRGDGAEVDLHVVGTKGIGYFRFPGVEMAAKRTDVPDRREPEHAASLVDGLMEAFEEGTLDAVHVVYAQFRSALSTPPRTMKVLPVEPPKTKAPEEGKAAEHLGKVGTVGVRPADPILEQLESLRTGERARLESGKRAYNAGRLAEAEAVGCHVKYSDYVVPSIDQHVLALTMGPNDALWRVVNRIENLKYLIIETAFSNKERHLAEISRHLCPETLAEELAKLERNAEIYVTHLKPGEIEPTMLEIEECAGKFRPRLLQNNLVLEF